MRVTEVIVRAVHELKSAGVMTRPGKYLRSPGHRRRWLGAFVALVLVPAGTSLSRIVVPEAVVAAAPANGLLQASFDDLGYTLPDGYVEQRTGAIAVFAPAAASDRTPCLYGLAGRLPSNGNLEADAESALTRTVVPGFRRLDDRHAAMRGTSAAGWPYAWYRAAFEGNFGGQLQAVNAMAMVLPAGSGRVHVVWGMGSIARCLLDDVSFEQLFHGLRPAAWSSDGGQAMSKALLGQWRFTAASGLQQLTFKEGGRYDRDLGSRARVGVSEQTSTTASGGRFTVRDGQLILTPDHRPDNPDRYFVRSYEEWFLGDWKPSLALLDSRAAPPLVVQYYRVDP